MIKVQRIPFIRRRSHKRGASPTIPPLVLLAAVFHPDNYFIELTFDRAIDIEEVDVFAFVVNDAEFTGGLYTGEVASHSGLNVLHLDLQSVDPAGPGNWVSASAANGLIAIDDPGTWEGVTELALPFP